MSVTANGPDGSTFSFPDGTPQEVVRRTLGKHYGWPDAQPQQRPTDAADPWAQFTPAPGQHPPPGADPWAQFKLAPQANAPPAAPARMPIFRVQGPDGSLYNVEAPDAEFRCRGAAWLGRRARIIGARGLQRGTGFWRHRS